MQFSGWNRAQKHRPKPNESAFGPNVVFFVLLLRRSSDQVQHTLQAETADESVSTMVESITTAGNELCRTLTIMYFVLLNRLVHQKKCESNKELQSKTEWMNRVHWTQIECRRKKVIIRFYCVVTWLCHVDNDLNDSIENITQWMQINLNNSIRFHVKWIEWNELKSQAIDEKCWDLFHCP